MSCHILHASGSVFKKSVFMLFLSPALFCFAAQTVEALAVSAQNSVTLVEKVLKAGMYRQSQIIQAYDVGASPRTVIPGTYTRITVSSPDSSTRNPDIIIGSGTVTLTGQDGPLFNIATNTTAGTGTRRDKLQIMADKDSSATLVLQAGEATGNVLLMPAQISGKWQEANLFIGDGTIEDPSASAKLPTVTLNGIISGGTNNYYYDSRYPGYQTTIETRGANLEVNGSIGRSRNKNILGAVNAYNGNITVNNSNISGISEDANILTYLLNVKPGFHIETNWGILTETVNLGDGAYIYSDVGTSSSANRGVIEIIDFIGDSTAASGGGSMAAGSRIESTTYITLDKGIKKAAGIISGNRGILGHQYNAKWTSETPMSPVYQNGADALALKSIHPTNESVGNIVLGEINVDSVNASNSIVAGTITTGTPVNNRPYIENLAVAGQKNYPRYPITANTVEATKNIIAGEINLPRDGKTGSLSAANLFVYAAPEAGSLAPSFGNFTLTNGSFHLTGATPLNNIIKGSALNDTYDKASQVDGNMTVTGNVSSDFTTLQVQKTTSIESGDLTGTGLYTNSAEFKNVSSTSISDILKVTTEMNATGNGTFSVKTTEVGGTASVSGGSYGGDTFTANNANFSGMSNVIFDTSLTATNNIDLALGKKGSADIATTHAGKTLTISGGTFKGTELASGGDTVLKDAQSLDVTTGNIGGGLTATSNGTSAFGNLTVNGGVTLNSGTLNAGTLTTGAATKSGGDFTVTKGSFQLGEKSAEPSAIHGSLTCEKNIASNFTVLNIDKDANIDGGTLSGSALHAANATFSGFSNLAINSLLKSDGTISITNSSSNVASASAVGDMTVANGSYTGNSVNAATATFTGLNNIKLADSIAANDISIGLAAKGEASIQTANATGSLSINKGTYAGNSLIAGKNLTLTDLSSLTAAEGQIGGNLAVSGNGTSLFNNVAVEGKTTVTGGTFNAGTVTTAPKTGSGGDVTIKDASFQLGKAGSPASAIHGNLLATGTGTGTFSDLTVDGAANISGGQVTGTSLQANSVEFNNMDNLAISKQLSVTGDATISGTQDIRIQNANVGATSTVTSGNYTGDSLKAAIATFNNLDKLTLTDSLVAENISIELSEKGNAQIKNTSTTQALTVTGGTFTGTSVSTGTSASFTDLSSLSISDTAHIGGKLTILGNISSNLNRLNVEGATQIEGGALNIGTVTTGAVAGTGGDVSLKSTSFNLGQDSQTASAIHGNFSAEQIGSSTFKNLSVSNDFAISGGYLQGSELTATSGHFTNNTIAHIDNLVLSSQDISLNIEDGSVVTVKTLKDPAGNELVAQGGLYVLGSPNPDPDTEIEEIYLNDSGNFIADKAVVKVKFIESFATSGETHEVRAHRLLAEYLDINNVNLQLSGMGEYGSVIDQDLILTANKTTRLADTRVDGNMNITDGSVSARTLTVGKNATFNGVTLDLQGTGNNKSSIGGALTLNENATASLGDLNLAGVLTANGGTLAANLLNAQSDVLLSNVELTLNGTKNAPGHIGGKLQLENNPSASLGSITIDGDLIASQGSLDAQNLQVDGDARLEGVETSLHGTSINPGQIAGKLSLLANTMSQLEYLDIGKDLEVDGGTLEAQTMHIGQDANLKGASASLKGTLDNPGVVKGNLTLIDNPGASLGVLQVGQNLVANAGKLEAGSLQVNGDATLTAVDLKLAGTATNPDKINGNLNLRQNKNAQVASLVTGKNLEVQGGSFTSQSLNVGADMALTGVEVTLNGTGANPDKIKGNMSLENNQGADFGALEVGGALTASNGKMEATALHVGADALLTSVDLILNGSSENPDRIEGSLTLAKNSTSRAGYLETGSGITVDGGKFVFQSLNVGEDAVFSNAQVRSGENGTIAVTGSLTLDNNKESSFGTLETGRELVAKGGSLTTQSAHIGADATLTGVALTLNGTAKNPDTIKGDLTLLENNSALFGFLNTEGNLDVNKGSLKATRLDIGGDAAFSSVELDLNGLENAPDIIAGNLNLSNGTHADVGHMTVGGTVTVHDSAFAAYGLKAASMDFRNAAMDIDRIDISGDANISSGNMISIDMKADSATLGNGLIADLKNMILDGDTKLLNIGSQTDNIGGTQVQIDKLNLNSGHLTVGAVENGSALLAVRSFIARNGSEANINGHIGIGINGQLLLGTRDTGWLPPSLSDARAIFALAQPMRLGNGYGIHVAGEGQPQPLSSQARFDAASLFVIDASNPRIYYTGEYIKTALLNKNNGATGALSAESAASATVNPGAQIYIRNPVPNTVVVALGENIMTTYADQASRKRTGAEGGWTGSNLDYDNRDKVKIERLTGDYAGQFSVSPVITTDTPSSPDTPPSTPDLPSTPDTPPSTPDLPSTPDTPGVPDTPQNPDQPLTPINPSDTHPGAQPGIHDVIKNEGDKGNIGTKPHHLVTHHGAGFISHTIAHDNPHEATRLVEGSLRIPVLGAVPQMALSAHDAAESAMHDRANISRPLLGGEEIYARSFALWAVPLYKTSTAWNMQAGNMDYDYHGAIGGMAMGADITFEDVSRLGLAVNFGGGYSKSGGTLSETTNNMSFWGVGIYGAWRAGNFGVTSDVNFTSTYNKLK